jgi:hypothetical protein
MSMALIFAAMRQWLDKLLDADVAETHAQTAALHLKRLHHFAKSARSTRDRH